jgi:uncharacterized membrane protein YhaH (DUF805 family)
MNYQSVFANPLGRTSRAHFIGGLIVLLLAAAFYRFLVKAGLNGQWVLLTLLFPAFVLHARRLHDMGMTAWLLVVPVALTGVGVWPHPGSRTSLEATLTPIGLAIFAAVALWCCLGKGKAEANRFGEPAGAG